jgi:hypothetical protein
MTDTRLQVLRSLDKQDRLGEPAVLDLLTNGRTDESGAFTPGCGLSNAQAVTLLGLLKCVDAAFNLGHEHSVRIANRFEMIERLDAVILDIASGRTAWDELIDMRPANIGWVLDDIVAAYEARP